MLQTKNERIAKTEEMENKVLAYCDRHGIKVKFTSFNHEKMEFKAEGFGCDWLEAKSSEKGRITFKHNGKRTSIAK